MINASSSKLFFSLKSPCCLCPRIFLHGGVRKDEIGRDDFTSEWDIFPFWSPEACLSGCSFTYGWPDSQVSLQDLGALWARGCLFSSMGFSVHYLEEKAGKPLCPFLKIIFNYSVCITGWPLALVTWSSGKLQLGLKARSKNMMVKLNWSGESNCGRVFWGDVEAFLLWIEDDNK